MGEGCGGPQEPPEGGLTLALALATVPEDFEFLKPCGHGAGGILFLVTYTTIGINCGNNKKRTEYKGRGWLS